MNLPGPLPTATVMMGYGQKVGFQDAVEVVESTNEAINEFVEDVTHLDETLNPYNSWFNQRE